MPRAQRLDQLEGARREDVGRGALGQQRVELRARRAHRVEALRQRVVEGVEAALRRHGDRLHLLAAAEVRGEAVDALVRDDRRVDVEAHGVALAQGDARAHDRRLLDGSARAPLRHARLGRLGRRHHLGRRHRSLRRARHHTAAARRGGGWRGVREGGRHACHDGRRAGSGRVRGGAAGSALRGGRRVAIRGEEEGVRLREEPRHLADDRLVVCRFVGACIHLEEQLRTYREPQHRAIRRHVDRLADEASARRVLRAVAGGVTDREVRRVARQEAVHGLELGLGAGGAIGLAQRDGDDASLGMHLVDAPRVRREHGAHLLRPLIHQGGTSLGREGKDALYEGQRRVPAQREAGVGRVAKLRAPVREARRHLVCRDEVAEAGGERLGALGAALQAGHDRRGQHDGCGEDGALEEFGAGQQDHHLAIERLAHLRERCAQLARVDHLEKSRVASRGGGYRERWRADARLAAQYLAHHPHRRAGVGPLRGVECGLCVVDLAVVRVCGDAEQMHIREAI